MSVSRITVVVRMSVRTPQEVMNAAAIVLVIYFMLINMNASVRKYFCMIINIYYIHFEINGISSILIGQK